MSDIPPRSPQEPQPQDAPQPGGTEPGQPHAAGALPETPSESAEGQLAQRLAELQDQMLRARADAENTRRRAEEEISKARKFAIESFAESLLPVKDSLEMAIATHAAQPGISVEQVLEGVHATLRQLSAALERNKVVEINPAAAARFDPHHHQAISMVPAEQEPNPSVSVLQKGYLIADRVLRPALVTVAAPK